jgi:(S)-2-hydroxyglutarate dehydrogenase
MTFDVTIIGAGIVGLATAHKVITQNPRLRVCVIDKEDKIAQHQTGHNSGVIHSGIYYKAGSLKAINCQQGYQQLLDFCDDHGIKYDLCGKVIVATSEKEKGSLDNIYKRGIENGLTGIRKISSQEVKEIEPHVSCVEGVWVPQTGIVDYTDVSAKYAELIVQNGGTMFLGEKVVDIKSNKNETIVVTNKQEIKSKTVVNCGGLYSDKIAKHTNKDIDLKIIPFRGEYYDLKKEKEYLVKNLIYPVPNPDFPFLGVHFTRMIHGGVEAGPNAVLAFKREGYSRWDINPLELLETLTFSGFRKVAVKYWDEGWMEMKRSFSKRLFVNALQALIPEIQSEDIVRSGAGVRAQACDGAGNLLDDFAIFENDNIINVCNAPSPAATSSLAIGNTIASKVIKKLVH